MVALAFCGALPDKPSRMTGPERPLTCLESAMSDFALQRRMMVDCQLRTYDITDGRVLDVMGELPRERFVASSDQVIAYSDQPAAASDGPRGPTTRYLLTPMVLARLVQAARVGDGERVLDVATGTGYGVALAQRLGGTAVGIDSDASLVAQAKALLADLAPGGEVVQGPLEKGLAARAPFDVIIVEGSFEVEPEALFAQLADGGRLVGVKGTGRAGRAMLYRKSGDVVSGRPIFDAAAPVLAAFQRAPAFVF
jgi:protein-L-isoaspartate(D-aspartate) O-methyltransferase